VEGGMIFNDMGKKIEKIERQVSFYILFDIFPQKFSYFSLKIQLFHRKNSVISP